MSGVTSKELLIKKKKKYLLIIGSRVKNTIRKAKVMSPYRLWIAKKKKKDRLFSLKLFISSSSSCFFCATFSSSFVLFFLLLLILFLTTLSFFVCFAFSKAKTFHSFEYQICYDQVPSPWCLLLWSTKTTIILYLLINWIF